MLSAALSGGFSGCPQLAEMGIGAGGWEGGDRQEDVPRSSTSQRLAFIFQQENKSPMTGLGSGMPGSGREPGPPPPRVARQSQPWDGWRAGTHTCSKPLRKYLWANCSKGSAGEFRVRKMLGMGL